MVRTIFAILLLALPLSARPPGELSRIKWHDTTDVRPNVHKRDLTIDIDSSSFTLGAWGDECSFEFGMLNALMPFADNIVIDTVNGYPRVRMGSSAFGYEIFITPEGAFEWSAILYSRPAQNSFTFPIQTEGLEFLLQPLEYTQEELDDGVYRPDSVAGSYAVYHATRANDAIVVSGTDTTREEYLTGKAFHIYRPKAWDAAGDTVWVDMEVDATAGEMTLTLNRQWKNAATYPVTIDPVFGYDTIGTSSFVSSNYTMGFKLNYHEYTASSGDEVTWIHAYSSGNVYDVAMALYTNGGVGGSPDNLQFGGTDISCTSNWDSTSVSWSLVASTTYTVAIGLTSGGGNKTWWYDSHPSLNILSRDNGAYPMPDPWSEGSNRNYRLSMYVTYTTGGGPAPAPPTRRKRILQMQ